MIEKSDIIWDFNRTLIDRSGINAGVSVGNILYSDSSMSGDQSSASFSTLNTQYAVISTPNHRLENRSWTFEGWIYFQNNYGYDLGIVGNCESKEKNKCLHLNVRSSYLFFGFFANDFSGSRILLNNNWYHFAFVMNCETKQRSIYLDGIVDQQLYSDSCYQGRTTNMTIGASISSYYVSGFHGLIDQISFTNRSKSSKEILDDATLVAYFSFDNNTISDQGSLGLNARLVGSISLSKDGAHSNSLFIDSYVDSYLLIENLVRLGTQSYAFSFSLWIKPNEIHQSTLIHISTLPSGSSTWCLVFLGLDSRGNIVGCPWSKVEGDITGPVITIGSWTHIAISFSPSNGLRLYVNGTLYSSGTTGYSASGSSNYVFVGSPAAGTGCFGGSAIGGQYNGFVDELRIYSRELTASEVTALAT